VKDASQANRDPRRTYRLLSSRQPHGGSDAHDRKHVDLAAGQKLKLCVLEGRGRIVRLWLTLPVLGRASVLKDTILRMYWDSESAPSVEVPLGDFFGAAFGLPVHVVSDRVLIVGGGYLSRFEMPFNEGAIVEISNESHLPVRNLFFQIGYYEEPTRSEREPTFHAQFRRENPTTPGQPFKVLEARGKGWFAGTKMDIENRAWWLKPPLRDIPLPRGFGLGVLEGWETFIVDGEGPSMVTGTGTEDYFSGGFYFKQAPFSTPTFGCTKRSFLFGRVSAYRFHVDDPIYFSKSIDVTMDHGLRNSMAGDYSSVAYWYQDEPHVPFPALPDAKGRRLKFPWINVCQWLFLAAVFGLVLVLAVLWARRG
jgi:hypothetical protein